MQTKSDAYILSVFSLVLLLFAPWPAEAAELDDTIALCTSCHGEKGMPVESDMPIIWGQEFFYIYTQLKDYKAARRHSEFMNDVVADLSREKMKAISHYFSDKSWPSTGYQSTREDDAKAKTAASAGQCFQCHIGKYMGNSGVHHRFCLTFWIVVQSFLCSPAQSYSEPDLGQPGDEMIQAYLTEKTEKIHDRFLAQIESQQQLEQRLPKYRKEYFEMLGLWPLPEKTPLQVTATGRLEREGFTVEPQRLCLCSYGFALRFRPLRKLVTRPPQCD